MNLMELAALAATSAMTTAPSADLTEHDHKAAKERKRRDELERQRLAAEEARHEEERRRAAVEKPQVEEEEREPSEMRGGTAVRILGRLLKVRPAPLLIAGIVGAILIVGWLSTLFHKYDDVLNKPSTLRF